MINAVSIRHQRPFRAVTASDDLQLVFYTGLCRNIFIEKTWETNTLLGVPFKYSKVRYPHICAYIFLMSTHRQSDHITDLSKTWGIPTTVTYLLVWARIIKFSCMTARQAILLESLIAKVVTKEALYVPRYIIHENGAHDIHVTDGVLLESRRQDSCDFVHGWNSKAL